MEFSFSDIEREVKEFWKEKQVYKTENESSLPVGKPKYYVLDMFPYPSGAGLHVGHPLGYIASDIIARFKRLKGFNVLHPMGFDSFGLPAEQYAIQTGQHPAITSEKNIATFKEQLDKIGFSFDWSRELKTHDPKFYKWTQWIFIQLFHSYYNKKTDKAEAIEVLIAELEKNGNANVDAVTDQQELFSADDWKNFSAKQKSDVLLNYRIAYIADSWVNWCAALGTVLANDEVKDGVSERGGYPVERKLMKQWSMRITAYADRLLEGLNRVDYSEAMKETQRNWIGRSEGCSVRFQVSGFNTEGVSPLLGRGAGGEEESQEDKYLTGNKAIGSLLRDHARANRKSSTEAVNLLWQNLRGRKLNYKFRRQHPIRDYIPDFVCLEKKLIVELDGENHKSNKQYDEDRTRILTDLGYTIIRFWNAEVVKNVSKALTIIRKELESRPDFLIPAPSPREKGADASSELFIEVFTTRPDTIFGATFITLAPEHELIEQITTPEYKQAVDDYVKYAKNRSERERMADVKKITGQFTGAYAIHPFTNEKMPVWIAEYVLAGYGTGAVMAVPAHDSRDYAFAKHFNLPIKEVVTGGNAGAPYEGDGVNINSDFLDGLKTEDAKRKIIDEIETRNLGKRKVNYKLRDAVFGRQRYWGEPIPIYYDAEGIPQTVDEKDLPLILPEVDKYLPTETGEPPLARAKNWVYRPHPQPLSKGEGSAFAREQVSPRGGDLEGAFPRYQTADKTIWNTLKGNARANREKPTRAEDILWQHLRNHQLGDHFRRQHAIEAFIVDFVCLKKKLIVEVDGGIHEKQIEEDTAREEELKKFGFRIIRFKNEEVISDIDQVLKRINDELQRPYPQPLSKGEGSAFAREQVSPRGGDLEGAFPLETTTMPGWAGSCWYYLRYEDPDNDKEFASQKAIDYWQNIDLYLGGDEHGTGHLIYFRFWTKFLFDRGWIPFDEPAKKLVNQGKIQGRSLYFAYAYLISNKSPHNEINRWISIIPERFEFINDGQLISIDDQKYIVGGYVSYYVPLIYADKHDRLFEEEFKKLVRSDRRFENVNLDSNVVWDGIVEGNRYLKLIPQAEKMSKRFGNVVNPDEMVEKYGADAFRMYEMFLGPLEASKPWDTNGIEGVSRFIRKFWKLFFDEAGNLIVNDEEPAEAELKILHHTIKKSQDDIEKLSFNTSVSAFMICVNELTELNCHKRKILEPLLIIISPFAPFVTEYIWGKLGNEDSINYANYPVLNEKYLVENSFEYPVAVNGKTRHKINLPLDLSQQEVEEKILSISELKKYLDGKRPKKVIYVKGRMINVVV